MVSIGVARTAAIVIDGLCYVVVARYLGPGEYGQYLAVMAFLTLIDLTGDMTLVDITVREISNDRDNTGMWVSAATLLRMGMSAAGFLAYAAYVSFGPGRRTPSLLPAAWIAALMLPAGALRTTCSVSTSPAHASSRPLTSLRPVPANRAFPLSGMAALLRLGGTNSDMLTSDLMRLCPGNLLPDPTTPATAAAPSPTWPQMHGSSRPRDSGTASTTSATRGCSNSCSR